RVLLIQTRPAQVSRERQVLDRGPDGVDADDAEVEVRVTNCTGARDGGEVGAHQRLAGVSVLQLSIATVDRADPVGVPVVGEATTEPPGLDGLDATSRTTEHAVSDARETDALISASQAGAAVHREVLREQGLEVVLACTVGVDGLQVDRVTRTSR